MTLRYLREAQNFFFRLALGYSSMPSMSDSQIAMKSYSVLVADDSDDDRLFMRKALERSQKLKMVAEVPDGQQTIAYLTGKSNFQDRSKFPLPDVLILDLKMPGKSGYDVLEWLKGTPHPGLHVIVVSGSFLPEDVTRSFSLGAHDYHIKSARRIELDAMITKIESLIEKQADGFRAH